MKDYLKILDDLENFLKEHESELYADETKRCLYSELLEVKNYVREKVAEDIDKELFND